jgi:hypothetical protein
VRHWEDNPFPIFCGGKALKPYRAICGIAHTISSHEFRLCNTLPGKRPISGPYLHLLPADAPLAGSLTRVELHPKSCPSGIWYIYRHVTGTRWQSLASVHFEIAAIASAHVENSAVAFGYVGIIPAVNFFAFALAFSAAIWCLPRRQFKRSIFS